MESMFAGAQKCSSSQPACSANYRLHLSIEQSGGWGRRIRGQITVIQDTRTHLGLALASRALFTSITILHI
jgi:hypothetical protein